MSGNAKLFKEFALQSRFWCLVFLDFSARELPQTGKLLSLGPLGDEDAAVGVDEGAGDDEKDRFVAHSATSGGVR